MPIDVTCSGCSKTLRVKDELAGKKIRCPQCKGVVVVAAAGTDEKKWHLKLENEEVHELTRSELDAWAKERKITGDCQVLEEGGDQWQWASDLFPFLDEEPVADDPLSGPLDDVSAEAAAPAPAAPAPKPEVKPAVVEPKAQPKPQPAKKQPAKAPATPAPQQPAKQPAAQKPVEQKPVEQKPVAQPAAVASAPKEAPAVSDNPFDFGVADSPSARLRGKRKVKRTAASQEAAARAKAAKAAVKSGELSAADPDDPNAAVGESDKTKMLAIILCVCIWPLGIHRFYLGHTVIGLAQFFTLGGCGIWQFIDLVMLFTDKMTDAQGRPLQK